jgi:hypothetical protein
LELAHLQLEILQLEICWKQLLGLSDDAISIHVVVAGRRVLAIGNLVRRHDGTSAENKVRQVGKGKAEWKTNLDSKMKFDREVVSICRYQRKAHATVRSMVVVTYSGLLLKEDVLLDGGTRSQD